MQQTKSGRARRGSARRLGHAARGAQAGLVSAGLWVAAALQAQEPVTPTAAPSAAETAQAAELSGADINTSPLSLLPVTARDAGGWTAADVAARAQQISPRAKNASASATRAEQRADDAFSLFLPRAELKASYNRLSRVPVPTNLFPSSTMASGGTGMMDATGMSDQPTFFYNPNILNQYSLQASVSIPISDYFLSLRDYYKSAQSSEIVARYQRDGELAAVANDAKQAYFTLARAVAANTLARHRVQQLAHFTAEIRSLVAGGELRSVELAQARTREASAVAVLERAAASQRIAEQALRRQMGLELDTPVAIGEPLLEQRPNAVGELKPLIEAALRVRPEAQALLQLVRARTETRDAVSKTRLPSLALFGSVNYDNPNQRLFPPQQRFYGTWALGAQLTWSPTEFVVKGSDLKDADLEIVKAQNELSLLRDRIIVEVTQAYENARSARGAVAAAETAVASAQEALDVRLALFRAGEATSRHVLDAELDLRAAQLDYVDNVLATHVALAALEHATGGGLQRQDAMKTQPATTDP